ncbi:hypothetical protein NIES4101_56370 [Calothrix sp. NIES-4101]|nr:hypothetical protein NIES4101_56370 [Calothrix sp. NIES-4101]
MTAKNWYLGIKKCQSLIAIGRIVGESVYPYDIGNDFMSFRLNFKFFDYCEVTILPLIPNLHWIKNKRNWATFSGLDF